MVQTPKPNVANKMEDKPDVKEDIIEIFVENWNLRLVINCVFCTIPNELIINVKANNLKIGQSFSFA